ncbi:unnamed protein product [Dicrocoelium dendriticum]|nr:unnamed protein product [Dicrocoelium dendriticum]
MNILGKILIIVSCSLGIICCGTALGMYKKDKQKTTPTAEKAVIGCLITATILFSVNLLSVLFSLCSLCTDRLVGLCTSLMSGAASVMLAIAYVAFNKPRIDSSEFFPVTSEWLFGGIASGIGLFILCLTLSAS